MSVPTPDTTAGPESGQNDAAELARLYREVVLQHAVSPVGYGVSIAHTHRAERDNPLCGDRVALELRIEAGLIHAAAFSGEACAICMASASLLCEQLPGRTLAELEQIARSFQADLESGPDSVPLCPPRLRPLLGVRAYPARVACALLPWDTARAAVTAPSQASAW